MEYQKLTDRERKFLDYLLDGKQSAGIYNASIAQVVGWKAAGFDDAVVLFGQLIAKGWAEPAGWYVNDMEALNG